METRNVPNGYLAPIAARRGIASPRDAFLQGPQARGGYNPSVFHENLTPKVITQYKTAKMLQQIGQKAVLSNNPYVDTAMETLIQKGPGAEQSEEMPMRRPMGGKLPRKGAKAAAMKRAKRLVGAGAAFSPEVPLEDALRAANIETDRAALHALLKVCQALTPDASKSGANSHPSIWGSYQL